MAGIMGRRSARPRLSPSAISAICCTAKAESQLLREVKMAPAMAGAKSDDGFELSLGLEVVRPLGRFWSERREIGLMVGLDGLTWLGELMLKHLALSMAIVTMVAMDAAGVCGLWPRSFVILQGCFEANGRIPEDWFGLLRQRRKWGPIGSCL
eukprot:TRINITY_DN1353_c0_g1_i1.p2 TRINITY_DN1353_c0_g1~~TRINITY_DN1353_c0_g1_i1.p2  ORF type:complete len:153 (+),score=29.22 TRINITY_DN1353_c0_g1_i1:573-1031(+)